MSAFVVSAALVLGLVGAAHAQDDGNGGGDTSATSGDASTPSGDDGAAPAVGDTTDQGADQGGNAAPQGGEGGGN